MITQTYTRPRRAAVSPAAKAVGPVTRAIRGLRPNEMPSWEMREAEMRRQEAADLLALRRRVAKAVAQGIDFLDATGGDPDAEPNLGAPEGMIPEICARRATARATRRMPSETFAQGYGNDQEVDADIEREAGEEAEEVNEHGGEHDGREEEPDEPSLGAVDNVDQSFWAASDTQDREAGDDNGIADQAGENWLRGKLAGEFA